MCEAMHRAGTQCGEVRVEGADHGSENGEGQPGLVDWRPTMIDSLNTTLPVRPKR